MDIELKLPHAENYILNVPQKTKRKKELYEYIRKSLMQEHPGFSRDSLWDYRIYKADEKEIIIASVLSREFYIEKKVSDRKAGFYVLKGNVKLRLFERHSFDEKGERKNHKKLYLMVLIVIFASVLLIVFTAFTNKKTEAVTEEPVREERVSEALNVFNLSNRLACVIEENKGVIRHFQFNAERAALFVFSVYGCEPYSLVSALEKQEEKIVCSCGAVTYSDRKESYEIRIEKEGCVLLQKACTQKELFQIQSSITKELNDCGVKLVSGGTDERNGRINFQMECTRKDLKVLNEKLSEIFLKDNLFPAAFSEMKTEGIDLFVIKMELVCLEERQKVSADAAEEKLSEIFEKDIPKPKEKQKEQVSVVQKESERRGYLKKIGSVKKEGKVYFYYRAADGKIETSEVDYE